VQYFVFRISCYITQFSGHNFFFPTNNSQTSSPVRNPTIQWLGVLYQEPWKTLTGYTTPNWTVGISISARITLQPCM